MTPLHAHVGSYATLFKLSVSIIFAIAVVALAPAFAETVGAAAYETGGKVRNLPGERYYEGKKQRIDSAPTYDGNWGYAPGGYWWNPNDMWHRSRGFWDTNSPACPFRSC